MVQNTPIAVHEVEGEDYICLTDMAKGEEGTDHIKNWMRNRNTLEFLGLWEAMNNPNFKGVEFDRFKRMAHAKFLTYKVSYFIKAYGFCNKS